MLGKCKDSHTTYFEGISTPPEGKYSKKEIAEIEKNYAEEQKQLFAKRQVEKIERLEKHCLDSENRKKYSLKKRAWSKITNVIDTIREHEPIKINDLNREYKAQIMNMLSGADARIQNVFLKYSDEVVFINENAIGRGVSKKKGIRINLKKDSQNDRGKFTTLFHEMGHSIDRAGGGISHKNPEFRNALIKDFESVVKEMEKAYNLDEDQVFSQISLMLREKKYHAISDIVGGITGNKCVGKYGHEKKYWTQKNALEKEAFAHFFESYARNDSEKIDALSQVFPSATEQFFEIIEVI